MYLTNVHGVPTVCHSAVLKCQSIVQRQGAVHFYSPHVMPSTKNHQKDRNLAEQVRCDILCRMERVQRGTPQGMSTQGVRKTIRIGVVTLARQGVVKRLAAAAPRWAGHWSHVRTIVLELSNAGQQKLSVSGWHSSNYLLTI